MLIPSAPYKPREILKQKFDAKIDQQQEKREISNKCVSIVSTLNIKQNCGVYIYEAMHW